MKNIGLIIVLFIFAIKANSLFAQEDKIELSIEDPSETDKILEKKLSENHLQLNQIKNFPIDKLYKVNKDMVSLEIDDSPELQRLPESIKNFKSLLSVSIYRTGLTEFPIGFCDINRLTSFSYGDNHSAVIPQEIGNLKNLKYLTLYRIPIKEVPKEIGDLENLQGLIISETEGNYTVSDVSFKLNGIDYIPKEIGNLKLLEYLILSKNNLMEIPKEIGLLNKLFALELRGNKLKSLPKEIYNLQNLKKLILSDNPLGSVSEDIGNLKKLEVLYLHNIKLKSLPKSIEGLKKLKKLDVSGNKIPNKKLIELKQKMPNTEIIF